jgi:hypothetical protein
MYEIVVSQDKDTKATKTCSSPFLDFMHGFTYQKGHNMLPLMLDL